MSHTPAPLPAPTTPTRRRRLWLLVVPTLMTVALTACMTPASKATGSPVSAEPTSEPTSEPTETPTDAPTDAPVEPTPDAPTEPPSSTPTDDPAVPGVEWTGKRPNIVTIMADDMRSDDLRFAPNVRRLIGRQGVTFNNSFSPYPLCCPARASFLTGMYAHNHGVYWHQKPYGYAAFDDSQTIATSLSEAGYRTAFVGKYLNGYGANRSKVSGKPSYKYVPNGWDDWYAAFEQVKGFTGGTYNYFTTPYNINGHPTQTRGRYQTNTVGGYARRIVTRNAKQKKPFYLYLSFTAPHHGGPAEADDPKMYGTPARPNWVKGKFDRMITRAPGLPKDGGPAEADNSDKPTQLRRLKELNPTQRRALVEVTRQRAEAIYVMDREIGRLIRTLKKRGEWNNTVLMFTSDNGYFLGEHRQPTGKVKAHEPSLRVPFLLTGPGLRDGSSRNDPITTVDITATILDIAGATAPHLADGLSRLSTLLTGDHGWTVPVVTEGMHTRKGKRTLDAFAKGDARTSVGLRTPRYSFTRYDTGEGELYDLATDPAQMRNRYNDPAYTHVQDTLTRLWFDYKDCAGATCHAALPAEFTATPTQLADANRHYWNRIDALYGVRP